MNVVDIAVKSITAPAWNPNVMDAAMHQRLRKSVERFGVVAPLVVRESESGRYETIGGAQRLSVLRELGHESVPCVVIEADDANARLLAQALNRIAGEDDTYLKHRSLKAMLEKFTADEVLALLPESAASLSGLSSLGAESLAAQLQAWQRSRSSRLHQLVLHLTSAQLATVHRAIATAADAPLDSRNPNRRSTVLAHICQLFLDSKAGPK